jgi:hypothetical protein
MKKFIWTKPHIAIKILRLELILNWRIVMEMNIKDKIAKLLDEVASMAEIRAIGQTGDINEIPRPGESDIDIFVMADKIPGFKERQALYNKNSSLFESLAMSVCEGG